MVWASDDDMGGGLRHNGGFGGGSNVCWTSPVD